MLSKPFSSDYQPVPILRSDGLEHAVVHICV